MSVRLCPALREVLDSLDPDLRLFAATMGSGLAPQLSRLQPALTPPATSPNGYELASLTLSGEEAFDGLALSACLGAHDAYLAQRGASGSVSLGALAIARILVWAQRAAILGTAPRIQWIGPPARRPEGREGLTLTATCRAVDGASSRSAKAIAILDPPPASPPPAAQ
jgi:hypothetical protein